MAEQPILGVSLCPERFSIVARERGTVKALATRELVQPFDHDTLRKSEDPLSSHVEILSDLYRKVGGKNKKIALVINSDLVMLKKTPLALGLDEKIARQIIEWEADQMTVSPINQYILDSHKLSFQTSNGNPVYLLVLVRKKIIQYIRRLVSRAGLQLFKVDVDVFANIRTLKDNFDISSDRNILLADIKPKYVELILVSKDEYYLSQRYAYSDAGIQAFSPDAKSIAQLIIKETKRLLFGHRLGQDIDDLDKIYVMGGELAHHVMKELAEEVSLAVDILNPFKRIIISPEVTQSKDYLRHPEEFISCLGVKG